MSSDFNLNFGNDFIKILENRHKDRWTVDVNFDDIKDIRQEVYDIYKEIFIGAEASKPDEWLSSRREENIRTAPMFPLPDVGNNLLLASRVPPQNIINNGNYQIQPGISSAGATQQGPIPPTQIHNASPPPTNTVPIVEGGQWPTEFFIFETPDGQKNRFATSLAAKVNTLHPRVRHMYASAIADYLRNNFVNAPLGQRRDINISESYRSPERSSQLAASGIRAAPGGRSWHNYGCAADFLIYIQRCPGTATNFTNCTWQWDDGRRGDGEYTGRLRSSMSKWGLINDLSGDSGHVYPQAIGRGVPNDVFSRRVSIDDYLRAKIQ
jgi:hypothetical protein